MDINLKCSCGSLKGIVRGPLRGKQNRAICLCDDCQTFAYFLDRPDEILDSTGGTEITPVYPAQLKLLEGAENLRCVRLSPKGLFRWYAGCCRTPIGNTKSPDLPFVGLIHSFMDLPDTGARAEMLGPVNARMQGKHGVGELPEGTSGAFSVRLILHTIPFLVKGLVKKLAKPSPFYDSPTGQPVVIPQTLTLDERRKLRSKLKGPRLK